MRFWRIATLTVVASAATWACDAFKASEDAAPTASSALQARSGWTPMRPRA